MKIAYKICIMFVTFASLSMQGALAQQVLTLEACKEMALEQNNSIKSAQAEVEIARSQKKESDAQGKPTLDASGGGFYFGKPITAIAPEYGMNASVNLNQSIYDGGVVKAGKKSAQKNLEISQEQKALQTSEVMYNTEQAYWNVIAAAEKIALADENKKLLDTLLQDLTNTYDAGLSYKNDVLQAKVQLYQAELNQRKAVDRLELNKMNLARVIGMGNDTDFVVQDSVGGQFAPVVAPVNLETAVANRSEVKILQKSIETSKLQEKVLKADFKPKVSLTAYGLYAAGPGVNISDQTNQMASYFGLLNVSLPIWDWGQRKQKVKQQAFNTTYTQLQLKDNEELLSIEIKQAYLELNQSVMNVRMSEEALKQADENLKLYKDRLAAGTITGKDVLEAQTLWRETYSALIDAKVEYKVNSANLVRVLGTN